MAKENDEDWLCPQCGTPMLDGYLTVPADSVHVVTMQSFEGGDLQAGVCPRCGFVDMGRETWTLV